MEAMLSAWMVYWSSSLICRAVGIFILSDNLVCMTYIYECGKAYGLIA